VGHLDADCFYVSAERARDSFLNGKAVGVLGNQGACVIAKSYEMKAAGVKTGEPIWEALVKCPDGIYIKRDFRWYEALSRQMLDTVRSWSRRVEYYSIDEFFFVAEPRRGQSFDDLALEARDRVEAAVGVPVTVGLARTRTLAKLISDSAKPHGARAVLDPQGEADLLNSLPVTEITGIAGRRERRLAAWNIRTCLDFARADRRLIRSVLTAAGEALWWELNGEPVTPIRPQRPLHKAVSRGGSFGQGSDRPTVIFAWLVRNIERLVEELEYYGLLAGRLTVWVAYRTGQAAIGQRHLAIPTDRFDLLLDAARPCLREAWIPRAVANRMHLIAEDLRDRSEAQLGLFDTGDPARAAALAQLKREVNRRIGRFALRSAATLPLNPFGLYDDPAHGYDICDVHGKMCF
jgi:nucleotidyltransferase/DNA polymerase involved in DNA repair